jgi:signal transduction histidine kinase
MPVGALHPKTLRLSFAARLVLFVGALLLLFAGVVIFGGLRATRWYLEEVDQTVHRDLAAHLVEEEPLLQGGEVQQAALEHVFHMLMVINPRIECYLLDAEGVILGYHAPPGEVVAQRVELAPIQRFLAAADISRSGEVIAPIRGSDPKEPGRPKIFSAAPIQVEGDLAGYLYVVLDGKHYASLRQQLAQSAVLRLAAATAVGAGLLTLIAAGWVLRHQTARLRALDQRMALLLPSGDSDALPGSGGARPAAGTASSRGDEIDRLDASFARMAERIQSQMLEISESDRIRRELVANVSHDLRTPVASLQGYLETLLMESGDLAQEQRREYLEVAYAQSERLGRLVGELFELARLDAGDAPLEREPFSFAELAQDVVQKYRLRASSCGVRLALDLDAEETARARVFADLRLIERVLENLVENALRHTGAEGSVVLALRRLEDAVQLEVRDTGCGIEAQELPYIFDRFYRVETRPDAPPGVEEVSAPSGLLRDEGAGERLRAGSGLGLSIAKRVVELHESELWVRSRSGAGSTFGFALALV